jgi:hypothetical protein
MTLAQVVYNISTDTDFAALWRTNPDSALAKRGFKLSKEEKAFLSAGINRGTSEEGLKVRLANIALATNWK